MAMNSIRTTFKHTSLLLAGAALIAALVFTSSARAHVVVQPGEITTATTNTFTLAVPNERTVPTVAVELHIPKGVTNVQPIAVVGWTIDITKDGDTVTKVTWRGGQIGEGLRGEFAFSAKTPEKAGDLHWKSYQTYQDGVVIAWDATDDHHEHSEIYTESHSGPASVVSVLDELPAAAEVADARRAAEDAQAAANRTLYAALAAALLAIAALILTSRKLGK